MLPTPAPSSTSSSTALVSQGYSRPFDRLDTATVYAQLEAQRKAAIDELESAPAPLRARGLPRGVARSLTRTSSQRSSLTSTSSRTPTSQAFIVALSSCRSTTARSSSPSTATTSSASLPRVRFGPFPWQRLRCAPLTGASTGSAEQGQAHRVPPPPERDLHGPLRLGAQARPPAVG